MKGLDNGNKDFVHSRFTSLGQRVKSSCDKSGMVLKVHL